jgi:hypothetical protein
MARFDTLHGLRIVADPAAVDTVVTGLPAEVTALRLAPDDILLVGCVGTPACPDPHAIVEPDLGFSGAWFTRAEFGQIVRPHMEWSVPTDGRLGQGLIAGVSSKVHVDGTTVLVVCPSAFVDELKERLG